MRARVVALLTAAVLGVGGGVATAVLTEPEAEPAADPLGLGIDLVDLECTGQPVLVLGFGDRAEALRPEILQAPDADVRYLDTRRSCDARWTPARSTAEPRWVAYVGPGDRTELCLARLSDEAHRRDNVTFLRSGGTERAMCLCEVPTDAAPRLEPGTPEAGDDRHRIWIGELQDMLIRIDAEAGGAEPFHLTDDDRTGVYDQRTAARVDLVRERVGLEPDGVLDTRVWDRIVASGCPLYDYA